ncbi:MAG: aconitase X catalytic domain-containing protein [Candidatus Atribacteria bacterium]
MRLADEEKKTLQGEQGEPKRVAMKILAHLGKVIGAERMIPVVSAHLVGCSYQIAGEAGIEIYTRLVEQGARVSIPTTLDPGSIDFERWNEFQTPKEYAKRQILISELLQKMGVIPTWSCTPYYFINIPRFGQHLAWSESSAVVFANSVIGARTNRMSAYVDLCAAIVGRVPYFGLHLQENRKGEILIELSPKLSDHLSDVYFPVLGYLIGQVSEDKIPVINGVRKASFDQLKAFGAAAASTGSVALYHMVGITPEARSLDEAFQGTKPLKKIQIRLGDIQETMESMRTYTGGKIDIVALGCPHASIEQIREYAKLLKGKHVHKEVELWICTNDMVEFMAQKMGHIKTIERAGGRIMVGTCLNDCPLSKWNFRYLVTDSGKFTYYTPTTIGTKCYYAETDVCIRAAIEGRIGEKQ